MREGFCFVVQLKGNDEIRNVFSYFYLGRYRFDYYKFMQ